MTDLALAWNADGFFADLLLGHGQLATDDGLRTAVLISLFTDARAPAGAELPEDGDDRRGWWGDDFAASDQFSGETRAENALGSTLWLLRRSKITPATLMRAKQAAQDALGWLIRDGIASTIAVEVEAQGQRLAIGVTIDRPQGPGRQRHDFTWEASTGALTA